MYIHGHYYNEQNQKISVAILTRGNRSEEVEIGKEGGSIFFDENPVEITSQVNDTFDHLLKSQARVSLQVRNYMEEFFCSSCRDAIVNIHQDGRCVFAGFIEPQTFSQGYNEVYDVLDLNCIDCLSALQYANYRGIGSLGVSYNLVKAEAQQRTFLEYLREIWSEVTRGLQLEGDEGMGVYYDRSKGVDSQEGSSLSVFGDISLSELLFLGDDEDNVWTQEQVLEEMLRYLNLHIVQVGLDFYIFDWQTLRQRNSAEWVDVMGKQPNRQLKMDTIDITSSLVTDCDAQISIENTYNQLLLTDSLKEMENVIESPLDSDALLYAFDGKQKYMTELSSDGEGRKAWRALRDMVKGRATDFGDACITDWYLQVRNCKNWKFYRPGKVDFIAEYCQGYDQQKLPQRMGTLMGATAILSVGKVKKDNGGNDNSPISRVDMSDYLVISINGNGTDSETGCYPNDAAIQQAIPCAEYVGNEVGGVFSPSDDDTTNYIVISGRMVMNPLMPTTATYTQLQKELPDTGDGSGLHPPYWHHTVASRNNSDGRYYTRHYWQAHHWRDEPATDPTPDNQQNPCFIPYTESGPQLYEFRYSGVGDATDNLSKVGVVQCMLIIGDKCVVEKQPGETLGTTVQGTGNGQLSDFVWMDYRSREQCQSDEEYYKQSFSIGFDPKIGDKIIGTEFSMQNNLSYTQGVNAEGIAIPIRKQDKVHGSVKFVILGPVNSIWNEVTRRHPSFWRHTRWGNNAVSLLAHTSCILIKELEVKVYSDNGKMGTTSGKDIVYMSDTKEDFVNRKDDLEMKITTALTSAECKQLGVSNALTVSAPLNEKTGDSLLSIHNFLTHETAKPEQHYVDAYWREWHAPRVLLSQSLRDDMAQWHLCYRHPYMGKTFYVQGISRDLTAGTASVVLKEVFE